MRSTFGWTLVGIYIVISIGFGIYALTCDFQWCGFMALVPATPWIQLFSRLDLFDMSQYVIPLMYVLNALILYGIGAGVQKLFSRR